MNRTDADRSRAAEPPALTLESALSSAASTALPEAPSPELADPTRPARRPARGLRTGLLGMLAIGLVPAVAGTALYIAHLREIALRDAYGQAFLLAGGTSERLRWLVQDAQAMLAAVATRPQVLAMDSRECDPIFEDFRDLSPAFRALSLRRLDGSSACSELAQPPSQQSVAAAAWFQAAVRQPGLYLSDVHVGNVTGQWTARITYPVVGRNGVTVGLLVTPVNLQQLQLRLFADVPSGAVAAVLDASNRVVVRSERQDERVGKPAPAGVQREIEALRRERAAAGGDAPLTRTFTEIGIDDQRRLYAVRTVPLTGWVVVAAFDEEETLQSYRVTRNRALAAIVGVLLLVGLAAWRVSRGILLPIDGLARAARGVAAGDNSRRAPLAGPREIREVAQEFNRMVVATDESAQRLRASESHYRTLIQNLPVAVVAHRPDTSIEVFNHRACSLLRMTHEQMQGRKALDRAWWFVDAQGQRLSPAQYPVSRVLQTRGPMPAEVLGIVSEGDAPPPGAAVDAPAGGTAPLPHTWVMVTAYPQFDVAGRLVRAVVVFVDVTLQRHHEELRLAKEKAEAASQAKTAFLSRVSHELRTPLNAINGFSELMLTDPTAPPATLTGAKHILDAGRHLLSLINQILDLTRIEAGQPDIVLRPLPLLPVLEDCLTICRPLAEARGIDLDLQPLEDDAARVVGDHTPLRQIVINLVSNAIKYNRPGGRVTLSVQHPSTDTLEIVVEDTGRGLSAEQVDALFQPFNRLGAEHSGIEGHGLGLAISRALAQLLGGDIAVDSEPGRGSRFTLRLRAAPGDGESPA